MLIRLMTVLALLGFPAASDASPGKTCSQVCHRMASCKLLSYDRCMDMCGEQGAEDTPESRASNLAQAKMSCSELAGQMAPSQWLCTAEGASSYGYDMDTSLPNVWGTQDIYMLGTGKTRSAAVYKAINDCNSIMTVQLNNQRLMNLDSSQGDWGAEVTPSATSRSASRPRRPRAELPIALTAEDATPRRERASLGRWP